MPGGEIVLLGAEWLSRAQNGRIAMPSMRARTNGTTISGLAGGRLAEKSSDRKFPGACCERSTPRRQSGGPSRKSVSINSKNCGYTALTFTIWLRFLRWIKLFSLFAPVRARCPSRRGTSFGEVYASGLRQSVLSLAVLDTPRHSKPQNSTPR